MYVTNTDPHRNSAAYRLEEIEAPTLIINAVDDPLANYEDAQAMARRIPQAQFVTIQRGGHLMVGNDHLVEDRINGFLAESYVGPKTFLSKIRLFCYNQGRRKRCDLYVSQAKQRSMNSHV
jgi:hypothetical protein